MTNPEPITPSGSPSHYIRNIPQQIKENVGLLMNGIAIIGDPARRMSMTSSLISIMLSALRDYYFSNVPPDYEQTIMECCAIMLKLVEERKRPDIEYLQKEIKEYLLKHTNNKDKIGHYLTVLRDVSQLKLARKNWNKANETYIMNPDAWSKSNEMLGEIHDEIYEIAIRHNMVIMPKTWQYNLERFDPLSHQLNKEPDRGETV